MKLLDVLTAPWAIEPGKLLEIQAIYATHLRGDKIDIGAVEARIGRPLANEPAPYQIIDGVAVLPLEGVIAKRMNMFTQISGGTSSELVSRDLRAALQDPAVHSIILSIDSPGGTVDGTQTLAALVAGATKPVVTLASGTMASAAYWIGSAAQGGVYIVDGTTAVGSIGVVATHTDISAAEAQRGVKTTEIYAGQYKRIASSYAPLTDAGRQTIQDQVDYTYSLFVAAVAQQRGTSEAKVLKDMADGRIFLGQQAIDAGLVDGVSTLDALVQQLNASRASGIALGPARAGVAQAANTLSLSNPSTGTTPMPITRDQLAAEAPDVLASIQAEGANAERARIQAIEATALPGHEKLIAAMKADGKSTAADAALAILAAEKTSRQAAAAALASDAPQPLPAAATAEALPAAGTPNLGAPGLLVQGTDATALDRAARDYQAAHPGASYVNALKAVQQLNQGA